MPGRPPLSRPGRARCRLGGQLREGKSQSPQGVPSLASLESKEKRCDLFKKHSERGGVQGSKEWKVHLGDSPQPEAEFLRGGPLLHPRGCAWLSISRRCPAPAPVLPSS